MENGNIQTSFSKIAVLEDKYNDMLVQNCGPKQNVLKDSAGSRVYE